MKGWLTGWKAIAEYLDVHIETAVIWHNDFGMPVFDSPAGRLKIALPALLDEWLIIYNQLIADNATTNQPTPQ